MPETAEEVCFAHHVPVVPVAVERKITARWAYWHGWVKLNFNKTGLPKIEFGSFLHAAMRVHRAAILECRSKRFRIPWNLITKYNLDDPMLVERESREKIATVRREYRRMCVCHSIKKQSPTSR